MKTLVITLFLVASSATYAQGQSERAATPKSCDDLVGMEKEACLKQGGTVKANSASAGSSSAPSEKSAPPPATGSSSESTAEPDAKKDYTKPEAK